MSDCRLNQHSEPFVSVGEMRRGFLATKRQKSLFSAFGPLLVPQNQIYPVTCRSSHETKLGIIGNGDSVIRSGFFVSVAWHEMSRLLVFAFRGNVFVEKCISPVRKTIRDIPERVVVERLR